MSTHLVEDSLMGGWQLGAISFETEKKRDFLTSKTVLAVVTAKLSRFPKELREWW